MPNGAEAIPVTNLKGLVTYSVSSPSDILAIAMRSARVYKYDYEVFRNFLYGITVAS